MNWAIPVASAPELPSPLRYEVHGEKGGEEHVFVSALLFHSRGLHARWAPFLRLSYPQMNLRLYVLDGDDVPSVLFLRMVVPFWVVPVSRYLGRQPATAGWFSYPSPSTDPAPGVWQWSLRSDLSLELSAGLSSPKIGPGPCLGNWEKTVDYIRRRRRGYLPWNGELRSITRSHPSVDIWPVEAEVEVSELLDEVFAGVDDELWRTPHSAWLCPEIPISFEVGKTRLTSLRRRRAIAAVPDGV